MFLRAHHHAHAEHVHHTHHHAVGKTEAAHMARLLSLRLTGL